MTNNLSIGGFNAGFNGGVVAEEANAKPLSKMNKAELQAVCKAKGLDVEGTKAELIERIKKKD